MTPTELERVRVPCLTPNQGWLRHRWETVKGTMSTPDHPYTERRCQRCGTYESEVR